MQCDAIQRVVVGWCSSDSRWAGEVVFSFVAFLVRRGRDNAICLKPDEA